MIIYNLLITENSFKNNQKIITQNIQRKNTTRKSPQKKTLHSNTNKK